MFLDKCNIQGFFYPFSTVSDVYALCVSIHVTPVVSYLPQFPPEQSTHSPEQKPDKDSVRNHHCSHYSHLNRSKSTSHMRNLNSQNSQTFNFFFLYAIENEMIKAVRKTNSRRVGQRKGRMKEFWL